MRALHRAAAWGLAPVFCGTGVPPVAWHRVALWALVLAFSLVGPPVQAQPAPSAARTAAPLKEIAGAALPPQSQPVRSLDDLPAVQALQQRAEDALASGDLDGAAARLAEAIAQEGGSVYEIQALLARTRGMQGRWTEARSAAQRAAELRPGGADAHFLLAAVEYQDRHLPVALAHFRTVTQAAPREADNPRVTAAWYHLGRCLAEQGYLTAAAEAYEQFDRAIWETHTEHRVADEVGPILRTHQHGALELRLDLLDRLGRADDAGALSAWAMDNLPRDAALVELRARALLAVGKPDEALAVLDAQPGDAEAPTAEPATPGTTRFAALKAGGKLTAWREAAEARLAAGGDRTAVAASAHILQRMGEVAEATRLWQALCTAAPGDPNYAWALALAQREAGNLDSALDTLAALLRTRPDAPLPGRALTDWLAAGPDGAAAARLIEARRRRGDGDFAVDVALGLLAAAARAPALAQSLMASVVEQRPDWAAGRVLAGRVDLLDYRWDAALAQAKAALELDRNNAAAHYLQALALDGLDQNTAAQAAFRQAVRHGPGESEYLLGLARHLRRTGETPEAAQRYFQEALAATPPDERAFEDLIESYLASDKGDIARARLERAHREDYPDDVWRRVRTAVRFLEAPADDLLEELQRQFDRHPTDRRTGQRLATELARRGEFDRADAVLARIPRDGDDDSLIVAKILALRGRLAFAEAVKLLEGLRERYPNRRNVLSWLLEFQLFDFQLDAALATLRHALETSGDEALNVVLRLRQLDIQERFNDFPAALAAVEEWSRGGPAGRGDIWGALRLPLLVAAGRTDDAVALAAERLDAAPSSDEALARYVATCIAVRRPALAEERLRARLKAESKDALATELLLWTLTAAGKYEDALALARKLPDSTWAESLRRRMAMAEVRRAAGQYDLAIKELDALLALRQVQTNQAALTGLRRELLDVLVDAGQCDRALQEIDNWYGSAADEASRDMVLRLRRSVLQSAERVDEYLALSEQLLATSPTSAGLNNDLGYTLVDAGRDVARATALIRKAVAQEPLEAAYLDSLGWAYYKAGDFAAAREQLARACRLRARSGYLEALKSAIVDAAELGSARAAMRLADLLCDPHDAVLLDHLGDAEYRLGDGTRAAEAWKAALALVEKAEGSTDSQQRRDRETARKVRLKLTALERGEKPPVAPLAAEQPAGKN